MWWVGVVRKLVGFIDSMVVCEGYSNSVYFDRKFRKQEIYKPC